MIGIIGFGRFGKLTAHYLAEEFDVVVYQGRQIGHRKVRRFQKSQGGQIHLRDENPPQGGRIGGRCPEDLEV